jgi:hypothetical protein
MASLDFTIGMWQRLVIAAVAEDHHSFEDLRVWLRQLGHYPSRSAMTCSLTGLVRRGILVQDHEGRFAKGESWALAVRRYAVGGMGAGFSPPQPH